MNPYEILGLREGSSVEEATQRYNIMIRKLKDAGLSGNVLEKDVNFRMQQLRAAYDEIVYGIPCPDHLNEAIAVVQTEETTSPFLQIQVLIANERYEETIQRLRLIDSSTAHWRYLYGVALWGKGMAMDALPYLQQALAMEPNNETYRRDFLNLQSQVNTATQQENQRKTDAKVAGAAGAGCCAAGVCGECLCDALCDSC